MNVRETVSNGVHPDRLNGYPLPSLYDISSLPFYNVNSTLRSSGVRGCETVSVEPELSWTTGQCIAGAKRKWLEAVDGAEVPTGSLDGSLCPGLQNHSIARADNAGIYNGQMKVIHCVVTHSLAKLCC